ncbi:uncharacterized protein CTRU02_214306 [Colletotrichum truncatum]|uniref:Uncharacterized protein n=1 Tax=Colletotrichum truncatum TaxID=5467 RepID=A0ACC3YI61_COLTU|nr:uncharacterized protein CTRU02_11376 [Colletotrichum truncatum]KAF6786118.1 hypothetical protein CTRU02_11376 [Colletotrichum truncatum]
MADPLPQPTASAPEKGRPLREFRRSYKACKLCRRKKIRCIVDGPGKACLRCKRELRECVFPVERSHHAKNAEEIRIPYEPSSSISKIACEKPLNRPSLKFYAKIVVIVAKPHNAEDGQSQISDHSAHAAIDMTTVENWATTDEISVTPQNKQLRQSSLSSDVSMVPAASVSENAGNDRGESDMAGDLNATLMRTLVSNGNDALKLLFQAAIEQKEDETLSSVRQNQPVAGDTLTPDNRSSTATDPVEFSAASPTTLRVWDAFRFTKMGWFSSEEAVTYMDL